MAETYPLKIVSHEEVLFESSIESLIAPGIMGYLGVLAHHTPLVTMLAEGQLTLRINKDEVHYFHVNGGILEVSAQGVVILAETIAAVSRSGRPLSSH